MMDAPTSTDDAAARKGATGSVWSWIRAQTGMNPPADDAGVPVRVVSIDRIGRDLDPGEGDAREAKRAERELARMLTIERRSPSVRGWSISGFTTLGMLVTMVPLVFLFGMFITTGRAVFVALISSLGLWSVLADRMIRTARRGVIARSIVSRGHCGQCAYTLRDLPEDERGLVRCPECAASWLGTRISNPVWAPRRARLFERVGFPLWIRGITSATVLDHRGALCKRFSITLVGLPKGTRHLVDAPARKRIKRQVRSLGLVWRAAGAFLLVGSGTAVLLWGWSTWQGSPPDGILGMIVGVPLIIAGLQVVQGEFGVSGRRFIRRVLEIGRCPCCAAELPDTLDRDGLTTCGMCGSGWKTPDIAMAGEAREQGGSVSGSPTPPTPST